MKEYKSFVVYNFNIEDIKEYKNCNDNRLIMVAWDNKISKTEPIKWLIIGKGRGSIFKADRILNEYMHENYNHILSVNIYSVEDFLDDYYDEC